MIQIVLTRKIMHEPARSHRDTLTNHKHRTIKSRTTVFHVGDLTSNRTRPYFSQEGAELSISHVPQKWRAITDHVSGTTYKLTNPDGEFYSITPTTNTTKAERQLCTALGFITMRDGYRVEFTTHSGEQRYQLCYNKETAEQKREHNTDVTVSDVRVPALAENGIAYCERAFERDTETLAPTHVELFIPIWAAAQTTADGVYWEHPVNISKLSAPRGLIYQDLLTDWTISRK